MADGFDSPEAAALAGYSRASQARVLASVTNDDIGHAVVLIDTRPSHPYEVRCVRESGSWHENCGGNGCSWRLLDEESKVASQSLWDQVPEDVRAVRVQHGGVVAEASCSGGWFLWVRWDAPSDADDWPHVVAHLKAAGWVDVPVDRDLLRLERIVREGRPRRWRKLFPPWRWPFGLR